ncbi:hypothetical protein BH09ACT8_BH09ACT8_07550 [soil metagenome]
MIRVLFYYFLLSTVMSFALRCWTGSRLLFSQALIVVAYRYASAEKARRRCSPTSAWHW